jgi:methyl-accepting chemotaxis protein
MGAGIVVAGSFALAIIIAVAAVRRYRRRGADDVLPGRPDLGIRLPVNRFVGVDGGMATRINALLDDVGAALKHLFARGFEQTRISDSVKNDAGEMVEAADRTRILAGQVGASMNEMTTLVAEIARTVNETSRGARRGEDTLEGQDSSLESVKKLSLQISTWAETNKAP